MCCSASSPSSRAGEKIGVRLIAGLIARRIVPWVAQNDAVQRGERISLIQFGSRVDVYLPRNAKIKVQARRPRGRRRNRAGRNLTDTMATNPATHPPPAESDEAEDLFSAEPADGGKSVLRLSWR